MQEGVRFSYLRWSGGLTLLAKNFNRIDRQSYYLMRIDKLKIDTEVYSSSSGVSARP